MHQPAEIRTEWLTALEWIRLADRLVEAEVFGDGARSSYSFTVFLAHWRQLRDGRLPRQSPFCSLFERLQRRWSTEPVPERVLQVWDLYLESLWRYRNPSDVIKTLDDHREADLRREAAALLSASGLHPSWDRMLSNFPTRYSRVEYVARQCGYNAGAFGDRYWSLTRADLAAGTDVSSAAR